jgi:hypothetical protein
MKEAARVTDMVQHPLPPILGPGPGSMTVLIGFMPAWRGVPAAAAASMQAAKKASDATIQAAEAASKAAMGTPGAPAAKAAEEATKASCAAAMASTITSGAGGADIHVCSQPLPIPPHGPGVVINGSATVVIDNLPACRKDDTIMEAVGPPNKIMMGCMTVQIGDSGGGGGGGGGGAGGSSAAGGGGAGAAGGGGGAAGAAGGGVATAEAGADEAAPGSSTTEEAVGTHFIQIVLEDDQGKPFANERYEVKTASGRTIRGRLSADGFARIAVNETGNCEIKFPNLIDTLRRPGE